MSRTQEIVEHASQVLIGNYARLPVVMNRGEGSYLWDVEGKRYIDLFAGFGGAILGHCHPALVDAVARQARTLWHVGNTFWTEPQIEVADRLNRIAFQGQAFFCHSGLEANEAACKLARLRQKDTSPRRWKIISLHSSFHGRSLAMIAATGNPKTRMGFEPVVPGFTQVEAGDLEALERAVDAETAGIILEPIQGEGGVNLHRIDYVQGVRQLCDRHGLTLIFDEVWTGCGRTGKWLGYQHFQVGDGLVVEPDVFTMAKAAGGGLPVGVMFAKPHVAKLLVPGTHGNTLGANALCMAACRAVLDVIEQENLLEHARAMGEYAVQRLEGDTGLKDKVHEVRGRGLMLGVELKQPPDRLVERALERGIVMNLTAGKVIRLSPALNISKGLWQEGLEGVIDLIKGLK